MARARISSALDAIAAIAMTLAAGTLISLFWTSQTTSQRNAGARVTPDQGYRVGEEFESIGLNRAPNGPTLVMYVRSSCQFCTASMAFYNRVAKGKSESARLVVVGPEPEEQLRRYLAEHGLEADQVVSVQRGLLRFAGTPTLLLLDPKGKIQRVWQGQLAAGQEGEVEESLR
jgi:peroxiredoxin